MAYQIIRIDKEKTKTGGNTHGWQIRAGQNLQRGYHSKLFSDGKYGGSDKALDEAEKYLQNYLQEHPEYNVKISDDGALFAGGLSVPSVRVIWLKHLCRAK